MTELAPDFELANVGPGPDPCSLGALAADNEFVVLLFQRDFYCTNCRKQVQAVKERYDEFEARDAVVASVLPEERDRAAEWQERYDLPYPLLADPDAIASDAYDQPVRFGILGKFSDFLGRMPEAVVVDTRGNEPTVAWSYAGSSTFDRPAIDDLLAELERLREAGTTATDDA
ncbi:peroxiredoxin family protein [Haloarchaeobius iranensis]|uniref:Peroxiredoxin Q/BCP n=1 Tax=Haloarchaeobius iranensis TaxID=996166 RepID=A0A1G9SJR8_9EURY|nr:redoxin domain-containing protein [Haloarchaeobius iranensis]SDM35540.1 peroxiredoxin Q/BCP [Haloarchaeobius iranensis]